MGKLTIEEVKKKLSEIDKDIIIKSDTYEGNKVHLICRCLICENDFLKTWNCLSKGQCCPSCGKNGGKYSRNEIEEHVKLYDYTLIAFTTFDSNKGTMFRVKCRLEHERETSFREFNRDEKKFSTSCQLCRKSTIGDFRRKDPREVRAKIEELGYALPSDFIYRNSNQTINITCKNGHTRNLKYPSICETPHCPECTGNPNKHTEADIQRILDEYNLKYISGYTGSNEKFLFECSCGEVAENTLKAIRKGIKCRKCNKMKRYTIGDAKKYFQDENYILLDDEYVNDRIKMKFICDNGHEGEISLNTFLSGHRCKTCHFEGVRGENSYRWNPNLTDEERINKRKFRENELWRSQVYKRDNYTCQCCGDNKGHNLNAHHLNSYDWAVDERIDVNNGITLCDLCHTDFHNLYGYGNNTREQYEEYIEDILNSAI